MSFHSFKDKTLDELDPPAWGDPDYDSGLVHRCHRLRRVKLREFDEADLRVMIGQRIGLPYLVPLALDNLEQHPLVEAEFYPGDLLTSLLKLDDAYWSTALDHRERVETIVRGLEEIPTELESDIEPFLQMAGTTDVPGGV